ncbi:LacI family DNA-binding transcriptional regulator [Lentzea sp. JNUCC 0626]|uniref:LacI family DNA-binding transcriptional regulator n=1 Tax=Lentzea sp. JNUCC 0626 TaxID=3367513 RepID=UPI0037478F39
MVTMRDVAALARVSVATVSNALNRPEAVAEATRTRVHAAITELGFVRNDSARRLRGAPGRTLAYLALDTTNPFFADVSRGIRDEAERHDLSLFVGDVGRDPRRQATYLDLLEQQRAEGVLVTPADDRDERLRALPRRGIPVVLVDRHLGTGFCSAAADDVLGGDLAATHLLDLGHHRLAFLGGTGGFPQIADRVRGARRAIGRTGRGSLLVVTSERLDVHAGRRGGERILGLPSARRPTAVLCGNDLVALGLLQHATSLGVAVPDELAIVGYDDIAMTEVATTPLTSVAQPRALLGRTAAELLVTEIARDPGHVHRQVVFRPELVIRASTSGSNA